MLAGQAREQQRRLVGQAVQRNAIAIMNRPGHWQAVFIKVVEQFDEERQLLMLTLFEQGEHQPPAISGHKEGAVFGARRDTFQTYQFAYIKALQKFRDLCVA